jgi:hypothetical protein
MADYDVELRVRVRLSIADEPTLVARREDFAMTEDDLMAHLAWMVGAQARSLSSLDGFADLPEELVTARVVFVDLENWTR